MNKGVHIPQQAMKSIDIPRVLVVDPDADNRELCREYLQEHGTKVWATASGEGALEHLESGSFDVVLAELELPDMAGLELLEKALSAREDLEVIMMAAFGSVEDAVEAMRLGATDFLSKPFSAEQLCLAIDKATRTHQLLVENHDLKEALDDRLKLDNMVATDPRMQHILKTVKAVAKARTTVLITGESGTGKTLLARAIHQNSPRADGPFVEINCGALPESLLESELFGHVRGAFTGALKDRPGKFELADTGTIFLDEIGTSSKGFQVKLLRVLQDRVIERVGGSQTIPIDVRIVLASNLDLAQAVVDGDFREDLYYRIQVVSLEMPPLRERRSDIANLADHFLCRYASEMDKHVTGFSRQALQALLGAPWPGNVRQLQNVIEHAVVLTEHEQIQVSDLPTTPGAATLHRVESLEDRPPLLSEAELVETDLHRLPLKTALEYPEKILIQRALALHDGNRNSTAASLGINRSTLFNKMRKYDLL